MEVKGITTVTLTDGSVEAVSGAKKVTFKMITLDDHWEEQKLLETPATPMELCSDSSGTQQVGPTQLDEVPKTPLDAVVSTATPQEPHSQLAGWRRTVHSAARECMQEIQERVAVAISLKIIRFTRSWWIFAMDCGQIPLSTRVTRTRPCVLRACTCICVTWNQTKRLKRLLWSLRM